MDMAHSCWLLKICISQLFLFVFFYAFTSVLSHKAPYQLKSRERTQIYIKVEKQGSKQHDSIENNQLKIV